MNALSPYSRTPINPEDQKNILTCTLTHEKSKISPECPSRLKAAALWGIMSSYVAMTIKNPFKISSVPVQVAVGAIAIGGGHTLGCWFSLDGLVGGED